VADNPNPDEAAESIGQLLTGRDPSAQGRGIAWRTSFSALRERPLTGHGLGTAGQTALRLNRQEGTGGESLYFKFTGEMGLPGLITYLGVFLGVIWFGLRQVWRARWTPAAAFPLLVVTAAIGIAVSGISTPLYDVPFMTYVFWFLAGMVVTRDRGPWTVGRGPWAGDDDAERPRVLGTRYSVRRTDPEAGA